AHIALHPVVVEARHGLDQCPAHTVVARDPDLEPIVDLARAVEPMPVADHRLDVGSHVERRCRERRLAAVDVALADAVRNRALSGFEAHRARRGWWLELGL